MQERYALAFRSDAWGFVDQPESGCTASRERAVQIIDGEAHVMNARASFGDEFPDRRVRGLGFEQFNQRFSSSNTRDGGAVGVVQRNLGHPEDVTVEGQQFAHGLHGDANVSDAGAARFAGRFGHVVGA